MNSNPSDKRPEWFKNLINNLISNILFLHTAQDALFERLLTQLDSNLIRQFCSACGDPLFCSRPFKPCLAKQTIEEQSAMNDWIFPTQEINNIEDLVGFSRNLRSYAPEQIYSSTDVIDSSHIFDSHHIFRSTNLRECSNVGWSNDCYSVANGLCLDRCSLSQESIRCFDSTRLSGCFDCYDSAYCSNCFGLSNCYDLMDCILCFHLTSRRWCVANMQYTQDDFEKIKKIYINSVGQLDATENKPENSVLLWQNKV